MSELMRGYFEFIVLHWQAFLMGSPHCLVLTETYVACRWSPHLEIVRVIGWLMQDFRILPEVRCLGLHGLVVPDLMDLVEKESILAWVLGR